MIKRHCKSEVDNEACQNDEWQYLPLCKKDFFLAVEDSSLGDLVNEAVVKWHLVLKSPEQGDIGQHLQCLLFDLRAATKKIGIS